MEDLNALINRLIKYNSEEDWFEFKENWFEATGIGEYISAMSNSAAAAGRDAAYLIWGISNDTHKLTGTTFNFHVDVKNEPLEHFLARQIVPDINFTFHELKLDKKRIVVLSIPAAKQVPTAWNGIRYFRIGSSKVNLIKYPERESQLFDILRNGLPTLETVESYTQELTFRKLALYYEDKGIILNKKTFEKNLGLRTKEGKYNLLAQLVSDNSQIPVRVSIFRGSDKTAPLYSVREFGNNCILITLDKVLEYGDVLNILQADETDRIVERKEVSLFNQKAFREAIVNAFVHNHWVDGNAPMISVYSDRIEILSRGTLAPKQTMEGFYLGESVPVNQKLSDIFLQLHISERSGRGIPVITSIYGVDAFEFRDNAIVVTIPFKKLSLNEADPDGTQAENKISELEKKLNPTRQKILAEMRNDPNITQRQLSIMIGIGKSAIENNIAYLRKHGFIQRIGSKKHGYWQVK